LYKKCNNENNYLLIPNFSKLSIIKDIKCKNISLITSVSDSFQFKNTRKSIDETKEDIKNIILNFEGNIKLYISCIDNCPQIGPISHEKILSEIEYYYNELNIRNICLSDTCGSLTYESFIDLVDKIKLINIPYEIFSLHLHVNNLSNESNKSNTIKIIHEALDRNITSFDVSLLETGGCSVTMNKTVPNLSYKIYYQALVDYIISKNK
jgi:pyruvate/oxaloacetate carboxyltransferase